MTVFEPITLASGTILKNRIVKAAMEENMAAAHQLPGKALWQLYREWAAGGSGLVITGNVMVDRAAMTGPGGVALEAHTPLENFATWAKAGKQQGTCLMMQINHPGRQVFKNMGGKVLAPSAVALNMGKHSGMFGQPVAMTEQQIVDVIERFVTTAKRAKAAGFDGVEVHAAHGYLLSQFLSPLVNKRDDQWGGNRVGRARLLLEIVRQIRDNCGADFMLSVKLNSADFQRGGFDIADASWVIEQLNAFNLDFVELSGGSYEAPAMQGVTADRRTLEREAYFLSFAEQIKQKASMPIMITGGIKRFEVAKQVIDAGIDLVGMASALAFNPDLPKLWQAGAKIDGYIPAVAWRDKAMRGLANMALVRRQLRRLGQGQKTSKSDSPLITLVLDQVRKLLQTKRYRKTL